MASFGVQDDEKDETRLGLSTLPFFSDVNLIPGVHTVKIRKGNIYIKEIQFIGHDEECTT